MKFNLKIVPLLESTSGQARSTAVLSNKGSIAQKVEASRGKVVHSCFSDEHEASWLHDNV